MRAASLAKIASQAEVLRLKGLAVRQGRRVAYGAAAAFFAAGVLISPMWPAGRFWRCMFELSGATLVLLGIDLGISILLGILQPGQNRERLTYVLLRNVRRNVPRGGVTYSLFLDRHKLDARAGYACVALLASGPSRPGNSLLLAKHTPQFHGTRDQTRGRSELIDIGVRHVPTGRRVCLMPDKSVPGSCFTDQLPAISVRASVDVLRLKGCLSPCTQARCPRGRCRVPATLAGGRLHGSP